MTRVGGRRQRGQGLVEFALVAPVFVLILIGMVDVGHAVWANNAVANAAREAARYTTVHGGTTANTCPIGPPAEKTVIPVASSSCPYPSPSKQATRETALAYLIAGGSETTVTVCYGSGCSGDTDASGATNARGTPVTVSVTTRVYMTLPSLLGLGPIQVTGTSTMLVNH